MSSVAAGAGVESFVSLGNSAQVSRVKGDMASLRSGAIAATFFVSLGNLTVKNAEAGRTCRAPLGKAPQPGVSNVLR